jgi:multiple sugar transport system substrate-binding protein
VRFIKPFCFSILLLFSMSFAQTLDFWAFGSASDPENQLFQSWVDEWNASHPDAQVKLSLFPTSDYVAGPVLPTAFASGTGPDIFLISPGLFMQYAESGIAADLSDLFTPEFRDDLFPAALEAVTVNGAPYSIPFEQEPVALYYNPQLFEEAGLEVPKSWDDLLSVAKTFKENGITPIVIEPSPGVYQNFTWYPFLWSTGAEVVTKDLSKATFDSQGAADALNLWRTLIQEGYAPRTTSNTTADITSTPFVTGEAAMWVGGIWAIAPLVNEYPDLEFDIDPLPTPSGEDPVSVYGGWTMMVNSRSENLEAAKDFASWVWIDETERPLQWATTEGVFSPRQSVMEAGSNFFSQPHYSTFRDEIQPIARAEPAFPADMVKIISDALQAAMFRGTPGEVAAERAQERLANYLKSR